MSLQISGVVLPLAHFQLQVTVEMTRRATAICGPSGAGKTSLLEVVAGLRRPTGGRVVFDGNDLSDLPARARRTGYVPQDDSLFPHLSVRRNILYGASDADLLPRISAVLEIEQILDRSTLHLSGGERKRVALARALLSRPQLLLLDEPLSGVDLDLRNRVLDYLIQIRDEFAIPLLYVTHDLGEAERFCDEVVRMEKGRITRP